MTFSGPHKEMAPHDLDHGHHAWMIPDFHYYRESMVDTMPTVRANSASAKRGGSRVRTTCSGLSPDVSEGGLSHIRHARRSANWRRDEGFFHPDREGARVVEITRRRCVLPDHLAWYQTGIIGSWR